MNWFFGGIVAGAVVCIVIEITGTAPDWPMFSRAAASKGGGK